MLSCMRRTFMRQCFTGIANGLIRDHMWWTLWARKNVIFGNVPTGLGGSGGAHGTRVHSSMDSIIGHWPRNSFCPGRSLPAWLVFPTGCLCLAFESAHDTTLLQSGYHVVGRWCPETLSVVAANALNGKLAIWSGQSRLPQDRGRSSSFSCHMALSLPFVVQNQRFSRDLRTQLIEFPRQRGRSSSPDELVGTQEASRAHRPLRVPCRRSAHPDKVDEHRPQVQSESSSPKHCLLIYSKVSCAA